MVAKDFWTTEDMTPFSTAIAASADWIVARPA